MIQRCHAVGTVSVASGLFFNTLRSSSSGRMRIPEISTSILREHGFGLWGDIQRICSTKCSAKQPHDQTPRPRFARVLFRVRFLFSLFPNAATDEVAGKSKREEHVADSRVQRYSHPEFGNAKKPDENFSGERLAPLWLKIP